MLLKALHHLRKLGLRIKAMARLLPLKGLPGIAEGHGKTVGVVEHPPGRFQAIEIRERQRCEAVATRLRSGKLGDFCLSTARHGAQSAGSARH